MMSIICLLAGIFSGWQVSLIVLAVIVLAALVALNVWFGFKFRIKYERKMIDDELQSKRTELLDKINYLNAGGEAQQYNWINYAFFGSEDDEEEDEEEVVKMETVEAGKQPPHTELLVVDNLDPKLRAKIGLRAKRFDGKCYYVRYTVGFEAKLCISDDETKAHYAEIMDEIRSYQGVSIEKNFYNQHITYGGEVLATFLFSGKRLCVALALDPKQYNTSKYRGDDKSDKKRFQRTPLLVRILSGDNKTETAKYFFARLAELKGLVRGADKNYSYDLAERTQEQFIMSGAVKVVIIADAPSPVGKN